MASPLPAGELEEALTAHYLRVDGPYGPTPLMFVDATEQELSRALKIEDPDEARSRFLASFPPDVVADVFRKGTERLRGPGGDCPGYFRYLLLSCAIECTSDESSAENDFRRLLADQIGISGYLSNIPGLAEMWKSLQAWCARPARRDRYREIVLPDPGFMTQIGYTRRITFPSRFDMRRMERLFAGHSTAPTPAAVIKAVDEERDRQRWFEAFLAAYEDFRARVDKGHRLLASHPFWLAMTKAWSVPEDAKLQERTTLEIFTNIDGETVAAIESDDPSVLAAMGRAPEDRDNPDHLRIETPVGSIVGILQMARSASVAALLRSVEEGVLLFEESGWGWKAVRFPETERVRILLRRDLARRVGIAVSRDCVLTGPRSDWVLTGPRSVEFGLEIASGVRRGAADAARVAAPRISGGIRVGSAFLGLDCCLPNLITSAEASVSVEAEGSRDSNLIVGRHDGSVFSLSCDGRLRGRWLLKIDEGAVRIANVGVAFVGEANEHDFSAGTPDPTKWVEERETEPYGLCKAPATAGDATAQGEGADDGCKALELAEAVYAGGERGWTEQDLVPLVLRATGSEPVSPWDVLRVLADGGWLDPRLSTSWRARKWFLRPPAMLQLDADVVVLDGAACGAVRRRFCECVRRLGGTLLRGPGGRWLTPLLGARNVDPQALAEEVGLARGPATVGLPLPARPLRFATSRYTAAGRRIASMWDWQEGRFRLTADNPPDLPHLERLQHEDNRSRDVYRLVHADGEEMYESRTAAILGAYQQAGRPLFRFDAARSVLTRGAEEGSLPSPVAKYLRLRHLAGPAIDIAESKVVFAYPANESDMPAIKAWLGEAVEFRETSPAPADDALMLAVLKNRGARNAEALAPLWRGRW